jgi:hypothetical protein
LFEKITGPMEQRAAYNRPGVPIGPVAVGSRQPHE